MTESHLIFFLINAGKIFYRKQWVARIYPQILFEKWLHTVTWMKYIYRFIYLLWIETLYISWYFGILPHITHFAYIQPFPLAHLSTHITLWWVDAPQCISNLSTGNWTRIFTAISFIISIAKRRIFWFN